MGNIYSSNSKGQEDRMDGNGKKNVIVSKKQQENSSQMDCSEYGKFHGKIGGKKPAGIKRNKLHVRT